LIELWIVDYSRSKTPETRSVPSTEIDKTLERATVEEEEEEKEEKEEEGRP
jgi:hypothetical protein